MATPVGKNAIILEALGYKLSTLVLSPTRRVAWPDLTFTPLVNEIYLRPRFLPGRSNFGAVGSTLRRHVGIYQVDVCGPPTKGSIPQMEVVDAVIEHFVSQVIVRNNASIRIGSYDGSSGVPYQSPELLEGGWRTIPITIPWWCDTF